MIIKVSSLTDTLKCTNILVTVSVPIQKGTCIGTSTLGKKKRSYYQFIYRQKIFKKDLITTCICKRSLIVTEGLF